MTEGWCRYRWCSYLHPNMITCASMKLKRSKASSVQTWLPFVPRPGYPSVCHSSAPLFVAFPFKHVLNKYPCRAQKHSQFYPFCGLTWETVTHCPLRQCVCAVFFLITSVVWQWPLHQAADGLVNFISWVSAPSLHRECLSGEGVLNLWGHYRQIKAHFDPISNVSYEIFKDPSLCQLVRL